MAEVDGIISAMGVQLRVQFEIPRHKVLNLQQGCLTALSHYLRSHFFHQTVHNPEKDFVKLTYPCPENALKIY